MQIPETQKKRDTIRDKKILQIGGLAAFLIGLVSLVVSNIFNALTPNITEPAFEGLTSPQADMAKFLGQFSQNLAPFGEMATLSIVMFAAIPLFLALYRLLGETSPNYALMGVVFGIMWAAILLTFLVLRFETLSTSAFLFSSATSGGQDTVVAVAEANYLSSYGLFYVGSILGAVGFITMGVAMRGNPSFRKGYGWTTFVTGILFGLGTLDNTYSAASNPDTQNPFFFIFAILFWMWLIVIGQKVYRLSRAINK